MSPLKNIFLYEIIMYLYNFPFTFNQVYNIGKFLYIHWPLVNPPSWNTQSFRQSPCILYDDHRRSVLSEQMKPNNQHVLCAYMCWCMLLIQHSRGRIKHISVSLGLVWSILCGHGSKKKIWMNSQTKQNYRIVTTWCVTYYYSHKYNLREKSDTPMNLLPYRNWVIFTCDREKTS